MSLPSSTDTYFQGLLSQRLGPDRQIDEELVILITEDVAFQTLCKSYGSADESPDGIARRVLAKAQSLSLDETSPHPWAIWSAVLEDPRFDLVWKRALDELREPLPVIRHSPFERLLAFLSRLKKTGQTASVLPLLLGTAAATSAVWVVPLVHDKVFASESSSHSIDSLRETNVQLQQIHTDLTTIAAKLNTNIVESPAPTSINLDPVIETIQKQSETTRNGLQELEETSRHEVLALESLKQSNNLHLESLANSQEQTRAALGTDLSQLQTTLKSVDGHTNQTTAALTEYSSGAAPYINKTLAESHKEVSIMQRQQTDALALQDIFKKPAFTVDSMKQGASFLLQLRNSSFCLAFQVLQNNRDNVILRYKTINSCASVSAVNALSGSDHDSIRLSSTPRLVSTASGEGPMALYLSLEQARGMTLLPPSGKRSYIGIYTKADWTIR